MRNIGAELKTTFKISFVEYPGLVNPLRTRTWNCSTFIARVASETRWNPGHAIGYGDVMGDPVLRMTHDHADINRRVLALGIRVRALGGTATGSASLVEPLAELREQLFTHFAREEEGLFPFVVEAVPELADQVRAMETVHDTICGAVSRMCHLAATNAPIAAIAAVLDRFENIYAVHGETEREVLERLDGKLDATGRAQLAAVVDGL